MRTSHCVPQSPLSDCVRCRHVREQSERDVQRLMVNGWMPIISHFCFWESVCLFVFARLQKGVCHATFNTDRCISLFPPLITHTHTHTLLWQLQSQASPVSHQPCPCLWSEQFRLWSALTQGWRNLREWNLSGKNQRLVQNLLNQRLHKQLRVCCGSLWAK